jgi:hypothetical protein
LLLVDNSLRASKTAGNALLAFAAANSGGSSA